ncbi:MAG: hypothetical protein ACI3ZR_04875, partial [bacterium]
MKRGGCFFSAGYTLLELMVVVSIMIIFLNVSFLVILDFESGLQLNRMALILQSEIRAMQLQAMTEAVFYEMRFEENLYRIYRRNILVKKAFLEPGVNFLGKPKPLSFTYTGFPSSGMSIGLINKIGKKKFVIINPAAGRVRISSTAAE